MAALRGVKTQPKTDGAKTHMVNDVAPQYAKGGGGRGNYSQADGDVPHALLCGRNAQPKVNELGGCPEGTLGDAEERRFTIYAKNLQSLQTEARLKELFAEVKQMDDWDVILVSETWR